MTLIWTFACIAFFLKLYQQFIFKAWRAAFFNKMNIFTIQLPLCPRNHLRFVIESIETFEILFVMPLII